MDAVEPAASKDIQVIEESQIQQRLVARVVPVAVGVVGEKVLPAGGERAQIEHRAGLRQVATVEELAGEVITGLEVLVTELRTRLHRRLQPVAQAGLDCESELVLERPRVGQLRETIGVLVDVVQVLVKRLVDELHRVVWLEDHVEVQRRDATAELVARRHEHLAAVQVRRAHG